MTAARRAVITLAFCLAAWPAAAQEFKSSAECTTGLAVANRREERGTIVSTEGPDCLVRWGDGTTTHRMPWMLHKAGTSMNTTDTLVNGVYQCYGGSMYLYMDVKIDGPDSYQDNKGSKGKYQLDKTTQDIRFLSGPLTEAKGKLMAGPRIGLNMNGGSFYSVTCSLKK